MSLKDIVNVTITRETQAVSQRGFGIGLILGSHKRFNDRIRFYSSLEAVADDFTTSDLEYVAAMAAFSQEKAVTKLAIGRRIVADTMSVLVYTVVNSTKYFTTINGVEFSFTSDANATNVEIAAGLVAAINAGSEPVTAADLLNGSYTLTANVASVPYTVKVDMRQQETLGANFQDASEDLYDIMDIDRTWYGIVLTSRDEDEVLDVAAWTEANKKIFFTASDDTDIINETEQSDTTSIAALVKNSSYARTAVFYHPNADTIFPDMAIFAVTATKVPGSYTTMFKTLYGIPTVMLTDTQQKNAIDKNCMIYTEVGGVNITQPGKVAEGEFIDIIILVDWTEARITERVFSRMVNLDKIPYTDNGIAIVDAEIRSVYDEGFSNGGFTDTPAPVITVPKAKNVASVDKINRFLPGVSFKFYLAGAIHATEINGVVTV